jgi:hypothetical protein
MDKIKLRIDISDVWGFFLVGEDSNGDHGLDSLV